MGIVRWFMSSLYIAAWLLLLKAIWDAGLTEQTGFLGWWAIANGRAPVYPPMPTTGLFRIIRQPSYVAFTLTLWMVPIWTPDQLAVALFLTAYLIGPQWKEKRFKRRFGQRFIAYEESRSLLVAMATPIDPPQRPVHLRRFRGLVGRYETLATDLAKLGPGSFCIL